MPPDDLEPLAMEPLGLGAVDPRGWLERQLEIQADGLTGGLEECWPDLADNRWRGGTYDGWERGPYYADGLVPLAHLLGDPDLEERADAWVEAFLERDADGLIGPAEPYDDAAYERADPWPRFVVLKALRQHHEATDDERAVEAMLEYCDYLVDALDERPLFSWGEYRWADLVVTLQWLYERTGEDWLLDLAATAAEQGYDWTGHFAGHHRSGFSYPRPVSGEDASLATHVVNNAMGIKAPAVRYRQSGDERDREAVGRGLEHLDTFHGQATGLFAGDEHLAGRDPTRGTELCAVVEFMYSLEQLLSILGDVAFADRLERVAYNALPATFTPDMWAHQYDQQANQVLCTIDDRGWTNGPDANIYGLEPNYGCCTANLHQGWPKLASHLWYRRAGGLAAVVYAPCAVTAEVDGVPVEIEEETDYPFDDEITLRVDPEEPLTFPLALRIPGWVEGATVTLPDGVERAGSGTFHVVEREWTPGDELGLSLPASVQAERRYQGAVTLSRGPLVFSLEPGSEFQHLAGERPGADWEVFPTEPWNYALDVDLDDPGADVDRRVRGPGETPFSPAEPPVELRVEGRRVPGWTLDGSDAGPLPASPVATGTDAESLTLLPYGCTNLRITEFPLLE